MACRQYFFKEVHQIEALGLKWYWLIYIPTYLSVKILFRDLPRISEDFIWEETNCSGVHTVTSYHIWFLILMIVQEILEILTLSRFDLKFEHFSCS